MFEISENMNSFVGWFGRKKLLREEKAKRFPENFGRYKCLEVPDGSFSIDKSMLTRKCIMMPTVIM